MHPRISKPLITALFLTFGLAFVSPGIGQSQVTAPEPQREQLLNGLKLLLWPRPGSPDLFIKLRIHSGAAFDLAGRSGQMALLGDLLFPDKETFDYFTEEMDGRLDVSVNYDSITITMQCKANELERILELLRNALVSTQLTPEVVARMREARIKIVRDTTISPETVADRAVATRLFGDYPYGRPAAGSVEDLTRVDRADLMQARERFLNSNNATLALIGGFTKPRAMRALRQLLGPWRKSEQIVPATFRLPGPPEKRVLIINGPADVAQLRLAVIGFGRNDPDYYAGKVLARILQHRWEAELPQMAKRPIFVRSESNFLPGMFVMGAAVDNSNVAEAINRARKLSESIVPTLASGAELDRARNELIVELHTMTGKPDAMPDLLLDADTYRLPANEDPVGSLMRLTPGDVQRAAARIFKGGSMAIIVIGDPAQLKTALQGKFPFEVLGEVAPVAKPPQTPTKP